MTAASPIDLRHGDCFAGFAGLADRSVDAVITDPPFDARTHRAALEGKLSKSGRRRISGTLPFAPLDAGAVSTLAAHFARVARGWIVVSCADRQIELWAAALEAAGARFVRLGIALRTNPRPQMTGDRPAPPADWLVIAHAAGARLGWNGGGHAACWLSPPAKLDPGGIVHPTQKPLALMRQLVADFTQPGELVLDPFAGSGSTALACKLLGRRFVGWECDPKYHAAACARLARPPAPPPPGGYVRQVVAALSRAAAIAGAIDESAVYATAVPAAAGGGNTP